MTERWQQYFDQRGVFNRSWLKAAVEHWGFHETLYGMIQQHCPAPARILDVGCGPGFSDLLLHSAGYELTGVDNDVRLVALAKDFAARFDLTAKFLQADAFDLSPFHGKFDLVYSCGVLEHFDREVTVQLLREQGRCAPFVLIQIPTRFTAYTGVITDERIYTMGELRRIVEEAGFIVRASFGYGDVNATSSLLWLRRLLPRALYRIFQNQGLAYSMAVLGLVKSD